MTNNFKKIRISCFLFLINAALFAQGNGRVAPMVFKFSASEGDTLIRNFKIFNEADEVQQFSVYLKDYRITEDGGEQELDPGSHARGCASWLTLSPQKLEIQPHSSENVRYTFLVPDSIMSGSYWSSIFIVPDKKPSLVLTKSSCRSGPK